MPRMRRGTALSLVLLGAVFAALLFSSVAIRSQDRETPPAATTGAAGPQTAALSWHETYGEAGQRLVFEVDRLQVLRDGWRAWVKLTNETPVAYRIGDPGSTVDHAFGLMLFATGDISELKRRNREGSLPSTRSATQYEPRLPRLLDPGATWQGTISAHGALAAGSWVRVVFGTLFAMGATDDSLDRVVVWITDHAYRLQPEESG
jgi:hypothetical protein